MKAGIVGLPNAGKSTLFNAFMKEALALAENYPFCTIDPNVGKVPLRDPRLDALAEVVKPERTLETSLECVDIAGLIKGASTGAGLGNSFLSNIRNVDLILQVVRAFDDPDTGEKPNVLHDVEIIEQELMLSDMQLLQNYADKNKKDTKNTLVQTALKAVACLDKCIRLIDADFTEDEITWFKQIGLLTIKPYIYIANVNEHEVDQDLEYVRVLREKGVVIVCCAKYEYALTQMPGGKTESSAIDKIIKAAYDTLGLITFFTAGVQEVRAWTIKRGATGPQAAGVIHTDFEKQFIRAEVVSYNDFIEYNGWDGARKVGKMRTEGRKYIVADGDVCFFKI